MSTCAGTSTYMFRVLLPTLVPAQRPTNESRDVL